MNKTKKIVYLQVLYQSDNSSFHDAIKDALNQLGFQVITLSDEKASIEAITSLTPDIIVIDLRRDESPNFQLYQKILASKETRKLPILTLTEKGYDPFVLGFESTDISDYICYPFETSAFLSVVNGLLNKT